MHEEIGHPTRTSFWSDFGQIAKPPYATKPMVDKVYGVCLLLFILGMSPMPYFYYMLLRLVVFCALAYFMSDLARWKNSSVPWTWALGVLMVLYNPFWPVHLGVQLVWTVINALTIYVMFRYRMARLVAASTEPPPPTE